MKRNKKERDKEKKKERKLREDRDGARKKRGEKKSTGFHAPKKSERCVYMNSSNQKMK